MKTIKKWKENSFHIPMCFILGLFPLLVFRVNVRTYTEDVVWLPSDRYDSDFFLFIKMVALLLCGILMLSLLFMSFRTLCQIPKEKFLWLLIGYGVFVLISALTSEHVSLSFRGMTGVMQGALVLLCYLLVFFYSMWWARTKGKWRPILVALGICIFLLGLIGLSQLFGFDLLSSGFAKELLGGREARAKNFVYLTLFHWNYVGSFVALILPITIGMVFYYKKKQSKKWMVWLGLFYLMILSLCGSQSRTGMLGTGIAVLIGGVIFRKQIRKCWKPVLLVLLSVIAIFMSCNYGITGSVIGKWNKPTHKTKGGKTLSYIKTEENKVQMKYKGKILEMTIEGEKENIFLHMTSEGEKVTLVSVEDKLQIEEKPFRLFTFKKVAIPTDDGWIYGYQIGYKKGAWIVTNQYSDGSYYCYNKNGKFDKMIKAETALPAWMNEFASLRGFVWSRTLPKLTDYLLVGAGPDQFGFVFPHSDYVARYKYDLLTTYYNKPHNWYLQMATETGCVSAVLMIVFWIVYLVKMFCLVKRKKETVADYLGAAIWFSILGYLCTAFFNDSFLTVAPVFWCLGGIGLGIKGKGTHLT